MSAPHIPPLLPTSRGGLRGRGGRGRGRGRGMPGHSRENPDGPVQATDTDAAVSRLSAVNIGFLEDPFAPYFVTGEPVRRLPVINRGTYTRTTAIDALIDSFISQTSSSSDSAQPKRQIISLGAGTDTRYFRLRSKSQHRNIVYHEFDFPSVSTAKWANVSRNKIFANGSEDEVLFPDIWAKQIPILGLGEEWGYKRVNGGGEEEIVYLCHSLDIRQLSGISAQVDPTGLRVGGITSADHIKGLRTDIPTLIISECCLCYLDAEVSKDIIKWFADKIPSLGVVVYEPIGPDDPFGQMMIANLASRNITMPSVLTYKTLSDQKTRLRELGFKSGNGSGGQEAKTIHNIWEDWVPIEEKERLDNLDRLDEVEEWQMLAQHYAVAWGWRGTDGWEGWKDSIDSK